jgi:transcriptional regulator with XRE-family HTH domain
MAEMTQADCARALEVSPQVLSQWLKRDDWRVSELERIAEAAGAELFCEFRTEDGKTV